jgi:hypothetical protein
MPRSILLGRPWPLPGEPLFLEDDLEALLEWQREQALVCPGCGLPGDETLDKDSAFSYRARVLRCHGCAARDRAAEERAKQESDDAGIFYMIERTDG